MYGPIWIIWGHSCYRDHDVEFVHSDKVEAEMHLERLRRGKAEAQGEYDHPSDVEFHIEERDQTILG